MNCPNCNAPVGAKDAFCLSCGQKLEAAQASPYTNPAAYAAPGAYGAAPVPGAPVKKASPLAGLLKSDKIKKLIPIAGIAVVVIIALIIISSITGSAKSVAKKYIQAELEGDVYSMVKLEMMDDDACKKILKTAAKRAGLSEKDYYLQACATINENSGEDAPVADFKNYKGLMKYATEVEQAATEKSYTETYGADYDIEVEIVDTVDVDKTEAAEYRMDLASDLTSLKTLADIDVGFDADDAKKFVKVYYHYTISGPTKTYSTRDDGNKPRELLLVKIKGDWKVYYGDAGADYFSAFDFPFDY